VNWVIGLGRQTQLVLFGCYQHPKSASFIITTDDLSLSERRASCYFVDFEKGPLGRFKRGGAKWEGGKYKPDKYRN